MLDIPDIFFGWTVDPGSEPTYTEKKEYPPGGGTTTFWQGELWDSCLQNPSESSVLFT